MNESYKLRDNCYFNPVYVKNEKGAYIFGCKENDAILLIKSSKKHAFYEFCKYLNGENSIKNIVNLGIVDEASAEKIIKLLKNRGFLEGYDKRVSFNEAELFSIPIFKWNISITKEWVRNGISVLLRIYFAVVTFLIFCIIAFYIKEPITSEELQSQLGFWIMGTAKQNIGYFLVIQGLTLFMYLAHEFFHLFFGLSSGLSSFSLRFSLYMGFIPITYVKHNNLYSVERKKLMQIIMAGIFGNISLAIIFFYLYLLCDKSIFLLMTLSNIKIIFTNIMPSSLSDGYFFLSILFRKPNTRMNMYRVLENPKKFSELANDEKILMTVMFCVFLCGTVVEAIWIVATLKFQYRALGTVMVSILLIIVVIIRMKIHKKKA